jgi:hypothetical protein
MCSTVQKIVIYTGIIACLMQTGCLANDWGYENAERGQTVKQKEADYSAVERTPREEPSWHQPQTESRKQQAVGDWLQLYSFVSGDSLSSEQKVQFQKQLGQFNTLQQTDLILSVLRFWPKVKLETTHNLDQVEGYRSLFKALLRMQLNYQPQSIAGGKDMAYEILGPSRIAVTGDPPLTEAAVNSYCDMACFLFEQKNPGRTMDVTENRAFFAKVIEDKFKNAPDTTAKEAMSNFDLNWAEFKIIWAGATPAQRKDLLKQWTEPGSNTVSMWAAGGISPSSTLSIVLKEGPWKELKGKVAGL